MIYSKALKNNIFSLISTCAEELNLECYVIGGFVRDYIIKKSIPKDIDIVVVGDGIEFANYVSKKIKNTPKVTIFKTYGTANTTSNRKWQWSHRLDDKFQMWHFYPGGNWQTYITVLPDNGRIGIKTSAPTNDLSINGNANKTGGGTWGTFSDRRIKKEIEDYTTGLDAILKIRPISYQVKL